MYTVSPRAIIKKITQKYIKEIKEFKYYTRKYPLNAKESNTGTVEEWKDTRHVENKKQNGRCIFNCIDNLNFKWISNSPIGSNAIQLLDSKIRIRTWSGYTTTRQNRL